ncbi:MAG TPA: hypothetical protein VG602_08020, partial [Actinomycetota bacterium]|nr:hypothetical protein [Actinomycetota bacterium]
MTGRHTMLAVGALVLVATAGVAAGVAGADSVGPPAASDPSVPSQTPDLGVGERLLLVIGGTYPTREEAVRANEGMPFGDIQGYYVAQTDQFEGLRQLLEKPDDYVLVTAFRTQAGDPRTGRSGPRSTPGCRRTASPRWPERPPRGHVSHPRG